MSPPISPQLKSILHAQWLNRAVSERDAHHRFLQLAHRIDGHSRYAALQPHLQQAAEDEYRHIDLCLKQAKRFGPSRLPPYSGCQPLFPDHLLQEFVLLFCILETINAGLLVKLKEHLEDERLRDTCHDILRDEVQHARIGWAALSLASEEELSTLWSNLDRVLKTAKLGSINRENTLSTTNSKWGIFNRQQRMSILEQTMDTVIMPGFAQFGLSSISAWKSLL